MNNFVQEWKSVNDDTIGLGSFISNEILKRSKRVKKTIGQYYGIPIKKGSFPYDVEDYIGVLDKITVKYTIYYCNDKDDYNKLLTHNALNCMADYDSAEIEINMAYIGKTLKSDFIEDINHEINHLIEIGNGSTKNETLYDSAVNIINDPNIPSIVEKSPAYLIYYTFKHEVDSFAVQFYTFLQNNVKEITDLDYKTIFEKSKNSFSYYKSVENCYRMAMDNFESKEIQGTIRKMGMSSNAWKIRVEKGIKRMERKFYHVFERHFIELNNKRFVEGKIKRDLLLSEQYNITEMTIEPIFEL